MGTDALSPLDGRYQGRLGDLRQIFSEDGLNRHRVWVEVNYLIELVGFLGVARLTQAQKKKLLFWAEKLTDKDLQRVKEIETEINHDVKAVEYFIKENLKKLKLEALSRWVHWGLTSEDVNNLSYGLMMTKGLSQVILPQEKTLLKKLIALAEKNKKTIMPARTHGQMAVPTTMGKELAVFGDRNLYFLNKISDLKLSGKLNGAVGNYNAWVKLYPKKDWQSFSRKLISKLGLKPTELTTQVEAGGSLVYLLDLLRQSNNVWLGLSQDMWWYISLNYCNQKKNKKEIGSSTMPQKVNPIEFENAEGNLQMANSLLNLLSNKLAVSRLQRDLSDSTVKRNLGVALGYTLLALKSLTKGLSQIIMNKALMEKEVIDNPMMLAEAEQLLAKVQGDALGYEKVRAKLKSGKQVVLPDVGEVTDYLGLAPQLTEKAINKINKFLKGNL